MVATAGGVTERPPGRIAAAMLVAAGLLPTKNVCSIWSLPKLTRTFQFPVGALPGNANVYHHVAL